MSQTRTAPFGTWRSPISAALVASESVRLSDVRLDGDTVYWIERRPSEKGRSVVVRRHGERTEDVTPSSFDARTKAHEYGGAAYTVFDGTLYVCRAEDQRVYRIGGAAEAEPLTPEGPFRYADLQVDPVRRRLIAVREDHSTDAKEPVHTLISIPLDGGEPRILESGADFYSSPVLDADGTRLAWLSWRHPAMPWDGTELWRASMRPDGTLAGAELVTGGPDESVFQPQWSPGGRLYWVSDRSGWWNLYADDGSGPRALAPREAEFARPQWVFGMSTYAIESENRLLCSYTETGNWHLAVLDVRRGTLERLAPSYTEIQQVRACAGKGACLAASPRESLALLHLDLDSGKIDILRRSSERTIDPRYLSAPRSIEFSTTGNDTAHALFYPPHNEDYRPPEGERPILLVKSHGGPTASASNALELGIQYWTSRGFAVVDVDYRGSSGYGRPYRQALDGGWGEVDVDDCVAAARHLAAEGEADPERRVIRGGSAGGFTTLAALTFRDDFQAGAVYYGIGDLEALARDTHKFESRYLDRLVGAYPEEKALYERRSPIHAAERLSCPVIFFQGGEDRVVPPNQSETMVDALRQKGVAVAYVFFPDEAHGFRRGENIVRALEAELYFYARVFGFEPPEGVEPVTVWNLDRKPGRGS